jgi:hypothetical protein
MSPFQGCRDRIDRATAHRETLGKIWNDLISEDGFYDVFIDVQNDGTGAISVAPSHDLPASCALELGETLYHLRSALDGAVYQAAVIKTGKNPPPDENRLEFPICFRAREFQDSARKIGPLSKKCRRFIQSVQPYKAPKLTSDLLVLNINRNLGILNDWARKDRHRQLHVVGSWASQANPKVRLPPGATLKSIRAVGDGFLKDHSEVATFRISGYVPGMKVEANPDLMIDIAVDEVPESCAINDTLGERLLQMIVATKVIVNTIEDICLGKI